MFTSISVASLITGLIDVIILIILAVFTLNKYTDEYILKYAGVYYIIVSAVSLLLIVTDLIALSTDVAFIKKTVLAEVALPIRLLFNTAELAIGIIIYKSRHSVSVLLFIAACFAGLLSAINLIARTSLASKISFTFMLLAIMAMLRQFRDMRRRAK